MEQDMNRVEVVMRWLQDNMYMGASCCNDFETSKDLLVRLDKYDKARAASNGAGTVVCPSCGSVNVDGVVGGEFRHDCKKCHRLFN